MNRRTLLGSLLLIAPALLSCTPATVVYWEIPQPERSQAATLADIAVLETILSELRYVPDNIYRDLRRPEQQTGGDSYKNEYLFLTFSPGRRFGGYLILEAPASLRRIELRFIELTQEFTPAAGWAAVELEDRLKQIFGERVKTHYAYRMKRFAVSN